MYILIASLFIAKIVFCIVIFIIGGGRFTLFPIIKLGEAKMLGNCPGSAVFFGICINFCIFLINKKDYENVKEYFINTLNIDIDKINKTYL